jgi:5-formyltetrahydrofolate cyclo-ligase
MELDDEKSALRKQLKKLRNGLPVEKRAEWSKQICGHVEKFCASRRIRRVAAFWPLGSEVDLRPLVASQPGWVFVFPRVASTHPPRLCWGPEPLEPGLFGLMEPTLAQHFYPPSQLLLVPGLAFDGGGYRIGYGGGYYDALLDRAGDGLIALGVAFEAQMLAELPIGPLDQPVHGIATEHGIRWLGNDGPADLE